MENNPLGIFWLTLVPQVSPVPLRFSEPAQHLHVMMRFRVRLHDSAEVAQLLGAPFEVMAIEECWNDRIQALRVALPDNLSHLCQNQHPHLTLSMNEGVRPVESNDMLSSDHTFAPISMVLPVVAEFAPLS